MKERIRKAAGSDIVLAALLIILGVLNFGCVFFPVVGEYWMAINGGIIVAIFGGALGYRLWRHLFRGLPVLLLLATASQPVFAEDPVVPDRRLTPGAVLTTDLGTICQKGYSKSVRHTSGKVKARIYREYGINRRTGHYEIDHLIPLSVGGADVAANLWPQSYDTQPWNATVKDRLELKLHGLVCHGRMDIREAQEAFSRNWIEAYKRFCPTDRDCPAYGRQKRD